MYRQLRRMLAVGVVGVVLFSASGAAHAASLTQVQISAIVSLLQSFGADASVVNNVQAALSGQATTSTTPPRDAAVIDNVCTIIGHTLSFGSTDTGTQGDVSLLQNFLGISPTGYFGPLTKQAVITWQRAHGINPIGVVGPATRAALACSSQSSVSPAQTSGTPTTNAPATNIPDTTTPSVSTPVTVGPTTQPATTPVVETPINFQPTTPSAQPQLTPATLSVSHTSGSVPLRVQLLYSSTIAANGADFFVDFGDGAYGNMVNGYACETPTSCVRGWNILHSYMSAGTFTIRLLTPTNPSAGICTSALSPGCTLLQQATVTVY